MILKSIYLYPDLVEFKAPSQDYLAVRDQTRHICNYLERQLVFLKFPTEGFNRICIIGYSNPPTEMYINSSHTLSVPIAFNMAESRGTPPNLLGDYYANLLKIGLKRCASEYSIPLSEMFHWLEELKQNGYRNEWMFKEKTFRQFGIKCRLDCELMLDAFTLRLHIIKKDKVLFDKKILTTAPDEVAFHYKFKDIIIEGDHLVVTTRLKAEDDRVLYKIPLSALD